MLIAISIGILSEFEFVDIAVVANSATVESIFIVLAYISLINLFMIIRWRAMAWVLKIDYDIKALFIVFPISNLSAMLLVGPLGGDFVRYGMMRRITKIQKDELLLTIIGDRVLSIVGIFGSISIFAAISIAQGNSNSINYLILYSIIGMFLMVIMLLMAISLISNSKYGSRSIFGWAKFAQETYLNVIFKRLELKYVYKMLFIVIIYIAISLFTGLVIGQIAIQILESGGTLLENSIATVVGNLASSIPLTPGGIGFGEAGYQYIVNESSNIDNKAINATPYFVFRAGNIFVNLFFSLIVVIAYGSFKLNKVIPKEV